MRKMIAILLCLCLLLCGCGGNETTPASESVSTAESTVSAPQDPSTPEASVSETAPEESIPEDPDELAKWVFRLLDDTQSAMTAYDVDITESSTTTQLGESTTGKSSYRVRELVGEDGSVTFHRSQQSDGLTEDIWFQDGTIYKSDYTGYFKAPMEQEAFLDEYGVFVEMEEIDENSFSTLSAEVTDTGYILTYGDLTVDAAMVLMDFYTDRLNEELAGLGIEVKLTSYSQSGVTELTKEGYPIRDDCTVTMTYSMAGIECEFQVEQTSIYNQVNSDLQINVPVDDADYISLSDITIPELFITGYTLTMSNYALEYQNAMALSVSDGETEDVYLATDVISYISGTDGLSAYWESASLCNDQVLEYSTDEYAAGEGVYTSSIGSESYTYDDYTYLSDISSFISYNSDSFDYGSNFVLTPDGETTVLTYDLDPEYAELAVGDYLLMYTDLTLEDASSCTASGTMTVGFDASGMVVVQSLACVCEADFDGTVLTFTLTDAGYVSALNDSVVLGGTSH